LQQKTEREAIRMGLLIHEVAMKANIHIATVKRAEKRGLISSVRDVNNWRRYHPDVVQKLRELYARESEQSDD
jgi:DNA-binding transcriptional MerR regulator